MFNRLTMAHMTCASLHPASRDSINWRVKPNLAERQPPSTDGQTKKKKKEKSMKKKDKMAVHLQHFDV